MRFSLRECGAPPSTEPQEKAKRFSGIVVMPYDPIEMPPRVRETGEGNCMFLEGRQTLRLEELPDRMVSFDELLRAPPLPRGVQVPIHPETRIAYMADTTCYPGSNYAIKLGVLDMANATHFWFSLVNGQRLQRNVGEGPGGSPLPASVPECFPSIPGNV